MWGRTYRRRATERAARAGGGHYEWLSLEREISFYFYSLSLEEIGYGTGPYIPVTAQ
jgi:hypothetical protein